MPSPRLASLALAAVLALPGQVAGAEAPGAAELIAAAESHLQAGRVDEAMTALERAISQAPDSSLAHTRLGGARVLRQDYAGAIGAFQRAITLDAGNGAAFVGMAIAYLHQGRYGPARAALGEASRLDASRKPEIEKLLAWIDQRAGPAAR